MKRPQITAWEWLNVLSLYCWLKSFPILYFAAPKDEIFRLKKNWLFMTLLLGCLNLISYTSTFSSFHQFITNPKEEAINRSLPGMNEVLFLEFTYVSMKLQLLYFLSYSLKNWRDAVYLGVNLA